MMELFCENSLQLSANDYFSKKATIDLIQGPKLSHPALKHINIVNPFLVNVPILYPPKNTKKSLVFWCSHGVYNGILDHK